MSLDEIVSALKSADETPVAALQAAVALADELAPVIYAVGDKFIGGTYLLPGDSKLLFYGLHVLAAAHHPGLCDRVLKLLHLDEAAQHELFSDHVPASLTRLLLTVWRPDVDDLRALMLDDTLTGESRWVIFDVLARLTFDGVIARETVVDLLTRIEQDDLIEAGDMAWWGWETAVRRLGVTELIPALERVWLKPINEMHRAEDNAETLEELKSAAANLSDPASFDEDNVRAIDDPVEATAWLTQWLQTRKNWAAEREGGGEDEDPARDHRLTLEERDWLAGFLVSRQAPDGAMTFELLDGLLTALVIGPDTVTPSEFLPHVWAADGGEGPVWDSAEQAEYFMALLMKHANAIATRRDADALHAPFILPFGESAAGLDWASGFAKGIELRTEEWAPMLRNRRAGEIVMPILALAVDDAAELGEGFDEEAREEIIEGLPVLLQMIADYWRSPSHPLPNEPLRARKVGRNEACPCGSGKKFTRCCGGANPPTVH